MRIGVISDTHVPRRSEMLPDQLLQGLQGVDMILHAGDLVTLAVLKELEPIAPVFAVHGNVDPSDVTDALPRRRIIQAGSHRIALVHGNVGTAPTTPMRALETFEGEDVDCIVFGHSHKPYNRDYFGLLLFNPGSPTDPRWEPTPTYGILHIERQIRGEIISLTG